MITPEASMNLRNIGPATEEWLRRVGINSREGLEKVGAEKAYGLIVEAGHQPHKNLLYALIGAVNDIDWRVIAWQHNDG